MTSIDFIQKALLFVEAEYLDHVDAQIVWLTYVLGNWKALIMVVDHPCYYEVTYNRSNQEIYVDRYVKEFNKSYEVDE